MTITSARILMPNASTGDKNEEKEKEIKEEFGRTCDWIKNRLVTRFQVSRFLTA